MNCCQTFVTSSSVNGRSRFVTEALTGASFGACSFLLNNEGVFFSVAPVRVMVDFTSGFAGLDAGIETDVSFLI
jgi:hypothetical protein